MKYARKCDVTGNGMNEGWCWGDGLFYTSTLQTTLSECRNDRDFILKVIVNDELGCELHELDSVQSEDDLTELGGELHELDSVQSEDDLTELESAVERAKKGMETDEDLLLIGYHTDYLYYTEWECDDDIQYQEVNGVLTKIK